MKSLVSRSILKRVSCLTTLNNINISFSINRRVPDKVAQVRFSQIEMCSEVCLELHQDGDVVLWRIGNRIKNTKLVDLQLASFFSLSLPLHFQLQEKSPEAQDTPVNSKAAWASPSSSLSQSEVCAPANLGHHHSPMWHPCISLHFVMSEKAFCQKFWRMLTWDPFLASCFSNFQKIMWLKIFLLSDFRKNPTDPTGQGTSGRSHGSTPRFPAHLWWDPHRVASTKPSSPGDGHVLLQGPWYPSSLPNAATYQHPSPHGCNLLPILRGLWWPAWLIKSGSEILWNGLQSCLNRCPATLVTSHLSSFSSSLRSRPHYFCGLEGRSTECFQSSPEDKWLATLTADTTFALSKPAIAATSCNAQVRPIPPPLRCAASVKVLDSTLWEHGWTRTCLERRPGRKTKTSLTPWPVKFDRSSI